MANYPLIIKYPFDPTGQAAESKIQSEPHVLVGGPNNRSMVPNYGAFYTDSVVVRDGDTGQTLQPRHQFQAVQLVQDATEQTGKEVCAIIVVTDTSVSDNVTIDYQVVGGRWSYIVPTLQELLRNTDLDDRPVRWSDVIGAPNRFPPTQHLHDAGDIYGFEYLVEALNRLSHAVAVGQEGVLNEMRDYIRTIGNRTDVGLEELRELIASVEEQALSGREVIARQLNGHIQDFESFQNAVGEQFQQAQQNLNRLAEAFDRHVQSNNQAFDDIDQALDDRYTKAETTARFALKNGSVDHRFKVRGAEDDADAINKGQVDNRIASVNQTINQLSQNLSQAQDAIANRYTKDETTARFALKNGSTDHHFKVKTGSGNSDAVNMAHLAQRLNDYLTKAAARAEYALKNGSTSHRFQVRNPEGNSDAVNIGYLAERLTHYLTKEAARAEYALKNGSTSHRFQVRSPENNDDAVNIRYLAEQLNDYLTTEAARSDYALKNGSTSHRFQVSDPNNGKDAVNIDHLNAQLRWYYTEEETDSRFYSKTQSDQRYPDANTVDSRLDNRFMKDESDERYYRRYQADSKFADKGQTQNELDDRYTKSQTYSKNQADQRFVRETTVAEGTVNLAHENTDTTSDGNWYEVLNKDIKISGGVHSVQDIYPVLFLDNFGIQLNQGDESKAGLRFTSEMYYYRGFFSSNEFDGVFLKIRVRARCITGWSNEGHDTIIGYKLLRYG